MGEHTCPKCGQPTDDDPEQFYPFGKLDPDNPIDQAIVRAFNRPTEEKGK